MKKVIAVFLLGIASSSAFAHISVTTDDYTPKEVFTSKMFQESDFSNADLYQQWDNFQPLKILRNDILSFTASAAITRLELEKVFNVKEASYDTNFLAELLKEMSVDQQAHFFCPAELSKLECSNLTWPSRLTYYQLRALLTEPTVPNFHPLLVQLLKKMKDSCANSLPPALVDWMSMEMHHGGTMASYGWETL